MNILLVPGSEQFLQDALREIGLSQQEIGLYTVSLALGPSPMGKIAEHLAISRPNIYKIVQNLEEKGLAAFSDKKKYSRLFIVEPPTVVLEKLREKRQGSEHKEQSLLSVMPDLLAQYRQGDMGAKVRVIRGKKEYLRLFDQMLEEEKETLRFCGSIQDLVAFIEPIEERKWIRSRMKHKLHMHCLVLPSEESSRLKEKDATEMRETRIFTETEPFPASFELFARKVVLWQPQAPIAVVIEDEYIVAMFRSLFDVLWRQNQ